MAANDSGGAEHIDMHFHVALLGDELQQWGRMSAGYRKSFPYRFFLLSSGLRDDDVSDFRLRALSTGIIRDTRLDRVVCLALDPVYDRSGARREDLSHVWVDNEYVLSLRDEVGDKVLLGASVHPYDASFRERVDHYVERGAVLLKWLPSTQHIDLADPRISAALAHLATARGGDPLPLLLHVGPEYAIPSTDPSTTSFDYLSWSAVDRLTNWLRLGRRWHTPRVDAIHANLRHGLDVGASIIFAHCGLPYFAPRWLGTWFEHSDFPVICDYLRSYRPGKPAESDRRGVMRARRWPRRLRRAWRRFGLPAAGSCYADVSALATPTRRSYYSDVAALPPQSLVFGSDFPAPVFQHRSRMAPSRADLRRALRGDLSHIIAPPGNPIDVNQSELMAEFPGHPLFTNFARLMSGDG